MTAVASAFRRRSWVRVARADLAPLGPRLQLARGALIVVCALSLGLLLQLLVVSSLQQRAAQQRVYDRFRAQLAEGTAPVGPLDSDGRVLAPGAPVAYLEIPSIGMRQVIVEGTTPGNLFNGPGHRRDTPLPGQSGTSIVLGRRAAFGGPFSRIHDLRSGARIRVTTGQGAFDFRVSDIRHEGDPAPDPPTAGEGRLLLATAAGRPFMPAGVVRVDAELDGEAAPGPARLVSSQTLPAEERIMGADARTLWALALWLQLLTLLAVGAVWAWHRWGPARAWVVFVAPLMLAGLSAAAEAARLLPNLL